jgi:hypothetical protein
VISIAEKSLAASGLFEAEVLTELLLWRWNHPLKSNAEFRENLLEDAATALRRAVAGEQFIESVPAAEMNLIAAIYYVESNFLLSGDMDPNGARRQWLHLVRRSLPSCFCPQSDLPAV